MKNIDDFLKYKNNNLVESFSVKYSISIDDSSTVFEDLLRFFYLIYYTKNNNIDTDISVEKSLIIIDEMWHLFIIDTIEYHKFCFHYFGFYIHHTPTKVSDQKLIAEKENIIFSQMKNDEIIAHRLEKKRKQYYLVYNLFGEEVFNRFYNLYKKKYSMLSLSFN